MGRLNGPGMPQKRKNIGLRLVSVVIVIIAEHSRIIPDTTEVIVIFA
jgi:hypothetical protein